MYGNTLPIQSESAFMEASETVSLTNGKVLNVKERVQRELWKSKSYSYQRTTNS